VTFDDGYADNLHEALPILQRHDLPATAFVATGPVTSAREFWWDDLDRLVAPADYDAEWRKLRDLGAADREHALGALRAAAAVSPVPRSDRRPLTPGELASLSQDAHIEIGSHTSWHSRLGVMPQAAQRAEIDDARRTLEAIIDRPIESFSYPFGRTGDYTAETMNLVRGAGFTRACINQAARVDRTTDRFALPRLYVRDWNGDEFAAALREYGVRV
jgi:peptidoglycan/xylan/chitin deacetylase (PgdA/CDA1 family)